MAKEHAQKRFAYLLFVEQGMDAKEISQMLKVSENTIGTWNKKDGWKQQRQARMLSPDKLIALCYEQSERIFELCKKEDRPMTSKEADAVIKLATAIKTIDKRVDSSINMTVLRNFNLFVMRIDPAVAKQNLPYQQEFIQQLLDGER